MAGSARKTPSTQPAALASSNLSDASETLTQFCLKGNQPMGQIDSFENINNNL